MTEREEPKVQRTAPVYKRPVWPVEARNIEEAREIWGRQGLTDMRTMTLDEMERLSPGYKSRRARLKTNDNRGKDR